MLLLASRTAPPPAPKNLHGSLREDDKVATFVKMVRRRTIMCDGVADYNHEHDDCKIYARENQ
jgi:hypothetical protein